MYEFGCFYSGIGKRERPYQRNQRIENGNYEINEQIETRRERLIPLSCASDRTLLQALPPQQLSHHAH